MSRSRRRERGQPEPSPEADSEEVRNREERIDEILEESFPASDAPAWSSVRVPDDPPDPSPASALPR